MKNYYKPFFCLFLLFTFVYESIAQSENQNNNMLPPIILPYQDSLMRALNKFGMRLDKDISQDQQCFKTGEGKIKPPLKGINPYPMPDSISVIYDRPGNILEYEGLNSKDINIIWVHGLNGTTNSLRAPAIATEIGVPSIGFPARRVKSTFGTRTSLSHKIQFYGEDQGITAATTDLNSYCRTFIPAQTRTIKDYIIAHSQGGIVSRDWLRNMENTPSLFENLAYGLVTLGTAHNGAQILNNVLPNMGNRVPAFMNEACQSLSKAIITPMLNDNFITRIAISQNFENTIVSKTCNTISKTVIPLALDNYYKSTTRDFYVGAPFLKGYNGPTGPVQGLSEYTIKVPVVQFFGVEEQPILWKFLSSTTGIGHDMLDENERYFSYTEDSQIEKQVIKNIGDLEAKSFAEQERIDYHQKRKQLALVSNFSFLIYLNAVQNIKSAQENKAAYINAKNWFCKANDMYLADLIGGTRMEVIKHCTVIDKLQCRDAIYNPVSSGIPPVNIEVKIKTESPAFSGNCGYTNGNVSQFYQNYRFLDEDQRIRQGNCEAHRIVIESFKSIKVEVPNDGVVLAESASHPIKVANRLSQFIVIMPKTNHEQMKNDFMTRRALTDLYEGKYGRLFRVSIR